MSRIKAALLLVLIVAALSATTGVVPKALAYKSTLAVPLGNGHTVTVNFDDDFPDDALSHNVAVLQSDLPKIAGLFYMPDHDFAVVYYALTSPGAYAGYRAVWIYVYSADTPTEDIIVHEFTHVFQFEAQSPWIQPPQLEALADAVSEIVTGGAGSESVLTADNGQVLYAKTKLYNTYHLATAWVKLYALDRAVFTQYTSNPDSFDGRDVFNALLGDTVIDSRPLSRWVYDQGAGYVGPTEGGFYAETQAYGIKPGSDYTQTWVQTTVLQWISEDASPVVVAPSVSCKFYQLTGELLSEVSADPNGRCEYYDPGNADALRVDVTINTGSGTIERSVYAFKYQEAGPGTTYYYDYVMLVGNDGLPLQVSGTATVSGSGWSLQVPVTNGLVKFSPSEDLGVADIDVDAGTVQYHYESFPFSPGARGVVVNPLLPYLGLYSEKWHVSASDTPHLEFTSYPAASGGNLEIEFKQRDSGTWQLLVSGVQPQNGRYEYGWGPTGSQEQTTYQFRAVWDGDGQLLTSNPITITRDGITPSPPCDYSLTVDPTGTTVRQGETAQVTVTATQNSGDCGTVSLGVSDWEGATGLSAIAEPSEGTPTFSSTLTIMAAQDASIGTFTVTVQGAGLETRTTHLTVQVEQRQTYDYTVSASGLGPGITAQVFLEDTYVGLLQNAQTYQFTGLQGEHTLSVDEYTSNNAPPGTRYHAPDHSIVVSASGSKEFQYHAEYLLLTSVNPQSAGTVSLQPPSQYGWYDADSSVLVSATPSDGDHTFEHWMLDASDAGTANPIQVVMSASHGIEAEFSSAQTTATITFQANGAGTDATGTILAVDGTPYTLAQLPIQMTWVIGTDHTISATESLGGGAGVQYEWRGWTNGNGLSGPTGTLTTPGSDQTVTMEYATQYRLVMGVSPQGSGTTNPAVGSLWYDAGTTVPISAAAGQGHSFSSWAGSGQDSYTGTSQTASVTMNEPITETATFSQTPPSPYDYTVTVDGLDSGAYTYLYVDDGLQQTLYNGGSYTYSGLSGAHTISALQYTTNGAQPGIRYYAPAYSISVSTAGSASIAYHAECQLTLQATPTGSGTSSPSDSWYAAGTDVPISAAPNNGYTFQSWTGSGIGSYTGTDNPATVTMSAPITETAEFDQAPPPPTYAYTATVSGLATGVTTVLSIDGSQAATLSNGQQHTFSGLSGTHTISVLQYTSVAQPSTRYHAATYSISVSTAGATTFAYHTEYQLTMQSSPAGSGTTIPTGTVWHDSGASAQISASPSSGHEFVSWTGSGTGSYSGTTNPTSIMMNAPVTEVANFAENPTQTYQVTVGTSPAGLDSPQGGGSYEQGTAITISVSNVDGYTFQSWRRDGANFAYTQEFQYTVDGEHTFTAVFTGGPPSPPYSATVTINSTPTGTGFVSVDGTPLSASEAQFSWAPGSAHTLTANSPVDEGSGTQYVWVSWSDGGEQTHVITVPDSLTSSYTATFKTQHLLTMTVDQGTGTTNPPTGTSWHDAGEEVQIAATPSSGYSFTGWEGSGTGAYTGTSATATVTMNGPVTEAANFQGSSNPSPRCIIATAAWGSEMAPEVVHMRYVRDQMIGSSAVGRTLVDAFNRFYYSWSSPVAAAIAGNSLLQAIFRVLLQPLTWIIEVTATAFTATLTMTGNADIASTAAFLLAAELSIAAYVLAPIALATGLVRPRKKIAQESD